MMMGRFKFNGSPSNKTRPIGDHGACSQYKIGYDLPLRELEPFPSAGLTVLFTLDLAGVAC